MTKKWICQSCSEVIRNVSMEKLKTFRCPDCGCHVWVEYENKVKQKGE